MSENGGHLASNMGIVELTIAIHSVFDLEKDRVVWDVGHKTYVHKICNHNRRWNTNRWTWKFNKGNHSKKKIEGVKIKCFAYPDEFIKHG